MVPIHGNSRFALRSCLQGKALELVKVIGGDFKEMVKRLDERYDSAERIICIEGH